MSKSKAQKTKQLILNKNYNEAFILNKGLAHNIAYTFIRRGSLYGYSDVDLVQEACIGLWSAVKEYNPELDIYFSTFAYTVIKRHLLKLFQVEKPIFSEEVKNEISISDHYITDNILTSEIKNKMNALSDEYKECILDTIHDISYAEQARMYDCSPENIRVRYNRALIKLRTIL